MELIQVNEDIYYLADRHMNYGVVHTGGNNCVVIDTGLDDKSGQLITAALDAKGFKLSGIINTHSHADHYGGNNYLVKKTGCKVYAPPIEAAIITNPSLESLYIFGAYPPEELRQPFLMGKYSPVDVLMDAPSIEIGNKSFEVISLRGHSPNQIGVIVDDICFCSDSVFTPEAWRRLVLVYAINIGEAIKSVERLKKVQAKGFIPSHVEPVGDITELAGFNLIQIQALIDGILHILHAPLETAAVLCELCGKHGLMLRSLQQYYLCIDTLKAYLSYLLEKDLIVYELNNNSLTWRSI